MDDIVTLRLADTQAGQSPRLGAQPLPDGRGATFTVWAPAAREVLLCWGYVQDFDGSWHHRKEARLCRVDGGVWTGLVPDLVHGDRYMFYVLGPEGGGEGVKRDPYARDLTDEPAWPNCQCLLCDPRRFGWHDAAYRPPAFHKMVIYQLRRYLVYS